MSNVYIKSYVTKEQKVKIEELAHRFGLTVSSLLKKLALSDTLYDQTHNLNVINLLEFKELLAEVSELIKEANLKDDQVKLSLALSKLQTNHINLKTAILNLNP